jgi:6,7-dimethyl-8-ribityllumazine synthase
LPLVGNLSEEGSRTSRNDRLKEGGYKEGSMKVIEGELQAKGLKFGIVVSRFNDFITSKLLDGALDALLRSGAKEDDIDVVRVPGSFEIPMVARKLATKGTYHAIICLGAVIRGSTPHFEYIAAEVSKGIASASMETGIPIAFGVITSDTIEQAVERAGTKSGNKGWDAAITAIEMAQLLKKL